MQRVRFEPGLGQRYVAHAPNRPDEVLRVTALVPPLSIHHCAVVVLRSEATTAEVRKSHVAFAADICRGALVPAELERVDQGDVTSLSDLLQKMSLPQLWRFTDRLAYVKAVSASDVGLSHRSADFKTVIAATHVARLAAIMRDNTAERDSKRVRPLPKAAPSPHSVYRWFLAYRSAGNDPRVLAREVMALRHRKARKPEARRLLDAFLQSQRAHVAKTSAAQLAADFNEFAKTVDATAVDTVIADLYKKAEEVAKANKAISESKGAFKRRAKPKSAH